jgi:hypothetical protein
MKIELSHLVSAIVILILLYLLQKRHAEVGSLKLFNICYIDVKHILQNFILTLIYLRCYLLV